MERRFNTFLDGLLSGDVVVSVTEQKALGPSLGRGSSFDRFDPNAWDGDGDGLVQEGTPFERPAIPGVNTDLPNVPKVPQVPVSNNKEVRIYDEISGSSRSMRAGINTARFPKLKRRGKRNRDLDIPQIIKEKTGTVDDGEASKLLAIKLENLKRQLEGGLITYEEHNSGRIISLVEYKRDRSLEQSETKAAFEIPREISGIGETGEDGNVIGFVNLIRFSSMHNGIRYLHSDDPSKMTPGPLVDSRGDGREVARRYPAELRAEGIRTLESMNQEFEEYLQQLRDGSGWDFPLTVSMGFSFIEKKEFDRSQQPEGTITSEEFTNHLYLENEEIPKYLAGIAYSMERALKEQVGGENFEGKIDIATADRIAKLLSKSWSVKQLNRDLLRDSNTAQEEIYDINMNDIFSPEGEISPGIPYFMPLGLGESGKYPDVVFEFPFDKDGADIPVVIKRGLRIHRQETIRPTGPVVKEIFNRYFFDTHQPEVLETEIIRETDEVIDGRRRPRGRDTWVIFPNTENPKLQVGKIEGPELNNSPFSSPLARPRLEGSTTRMDLQAFPFRITKDGIPYRFEPSFSVDEQPAIKRINEFLKEIGIPETKASETDSLYVPSEFDPRYLVVNGPLETPGKNEQRPKSYLDKLREAAAVYENTDPDFKKLKQIDGRMAQALLKKQSTRQTDDDETISVWVPEELVADNASIDALQREPQTPSSTAPPKQDMAQKIRERKIRKNLGLSDDEEIPPEYGGDSSRSKREGNITPFDLGRPEELDPDLEYYVDESNGFPVLRHPLVYAVPYMSSMNALYNRQYLGKKDQLADASDNGDWHGYVYLHERPYRLDALLEISDEVDDATFWSLLSGIWMDSENIPQNQELWNEIFDSGRAGMENMMRNDEREALAALPQKIKIYQGHTGDRDDGWSWTTDKSVALWFAQRFSQLEGSDAQVTEATADKNDVLAYLLGRGESEILVSPEDVVIDVTESAEDFQDRTDTENTYGDRSLSRRVDSLAVDSLTTTEFIDDFRQNDDDSSKLAENLGLSSSEPVDRRLRDLVNLGLIEDVSPFDSSRSKRSDDKKADRERALQRFMSLTDDEVVALFKEHDGSGTNVRVSLGNPNEKEFYARIEEMKKRGVKIPERGAKEKATFAKMSDKELLGLIDSNNGDREKTRRQLGLTSSVFYSRIQAMKKDSGDDSDSSRSKKGVYSFTPESDIAEQIRDREEAKKKASKEIVRVTPSTRKREEIREITSRIEEKVKSLSDITDSSALSEEEDEIDALSIELQSILNNITSFVPTDRGRVKTYVSVYGRTAFSDEPSSSYFEIRFDYLTESAEPGSWPGRTMYGDFYVDSNGVKFIRKSASRDDALDMGFSATFGVGTELYFDAFQNSIFSAMGVKKFRRVATSPKGIVYSSLDGLDWADEVSKSEFIKAIEWISEKDIIKMSDSTRAKLKELIAKARKEKLGNRNGVTPRDLLEGYDAVDAIRVYQREEFEARTDDAYMSIDFTGDIISPEDASGDGYYFGGDSSRSKRAISPERRKKLTTEASKLSARYSPSTRQREEIRTKMDEVRNNVEYYKEHPRELEDFIHDIFTRDFIPDGDSEEQFIVNLDGKDYELYFGTHVDFDTAYGKLEIRLARIPEGAADEESVLKPGIYRILIDDDGNMTAMKDMAETGDKVPSLVTLRGEGDVENFVKLNKAMDLIEESILSAMGIESFEQNATAYRGESGNMRRGISLSLAEGRTFADEEGKEIFLKIIESIAKNVEIDSDTRERLKTLHDRAKKEQLNKRNAVQPEDFLEDGLSEKYDLEKGIRDYLDDEKNGMRMLSIDFVKKIDSPDSYYFGGDSSRSERDSSTPEGFISPEEFKSEKEKAAREYGRYAPSSREIREFEKITKKISAMLAEIKDEEDEEKFLDSELLNEFRELLQSSFGKYLYGDEVVELEFLSNGFLVYGDTFSFPIVASTASPSLGRGYPSNLRNIYFGTMYIDKTGDISFQALNSHGHVSMRMGMSSTTDPGMVSMYREFMNTNNRSKQLARDAVFTENIMKAIGVKSTIKPFTSNTYFPPYSGGGDGLYADGITFAAEQDYYWADEDAKTKFLNLIQDIIDSTENTSKVNAATKKRLQELVNKSREEKFGKPNTVRPKDLIQGYDSREEIFWVKNVATTDSRRIERRSGVSIRFAIDATPTSDDSYYFGGDSSRSMKLRGRDTASLTPEERQRIRERAKRNTTMRLPSTRQREEMNSLANKISELQKMGTEEDRAFGVFLDEDTRIKVAVATKELGEFIRESIIGKMFINEQPVKLEVSLENYRPSLDGSILQDMVMFIRRDDDEESILRSTLLSRRFRIIFKKDGSIAVRKNEDAGDSTIEYGELGLTKDQVMRTELSAAMQNIEKNIASAIGAETMTASYYSSADRDEFGNVLIAANGVSFAADSDFDWATEEDKEQFLGIIEWSSKWLSAVSSGGWDVISETKSNELKNLVEKSRKEKFGKQNTIRPNDFSNAINLTELLARYSIRRGRFINIDFTEKVDSPYFYGGDSSRSSRSVKFVPDVAARKEIRKKAERDMARYAPSTRETEKIRDISERLRELAKNGPSSPEYSKNISAAYAELIDALNINKKININGEDVEIEIGKVFLGYDRKGERPYNGITISLAVKSKLSNGAEDRVLLGLSIDADGKINPYKTLTTSRNSMWSGYGPYPTDRFDPATGYSRPDESTAREGAPKNIIFRNSIDSMINNLIFAFGADTVDTPMSEGYGNIEISTSVEDGMTWATEEDKAKFLALIKWANSSPIRHFSTTRKLESNEELDREMIKLSELIKKAEAQPFGKSNTITPQQLLETLNHNEALSDAATNPYEGLSTAVTLTEKIKSPNSDSYYFGDSSRSKRSSEIANSDAPAPTKKQIQAIGELRNVVSDGRKDYRLFSDEERSIPKQIFDGKIKIGEEEYSSAIDTSNLFVSQLTNGSVEKTFKFSGKVLDKDGNEVASFSRGINFLDGKPVSVTHDGLYIKRVGQGLGVATALNARNEKLYKELGIPKVVVNASTSGDGKVRGITHWLRNGYSWDDSTSRNKVLKIIDKALQDSIIKDKEQESAVREIRESIRKNLSKLNDDINLESLANWDGADEWFSSMAKEEENQILNVKLSKNLDSSETSSRSERNSSIPNGPDGLSQDLKIQIDLVKQAMENVKAMGVTTTSYSHEDLNKNVIKKLNAEVLVIDKKIERVEKKFGDSEATLRGNEAVRLARLAIDTMARTPDEYQMRQGTDELLISRDSEGNLVGLAMTWTTVDEFSRQEYMENEESSETRELRSRALSVEYLVSFQTVKGMGRALFGEVLKKAAGKGILFTQLEPTMYSKEYWERVGFKDDTTSLKQDKLVLVTALDNLESLLP